MPLIGSSCFERKVRLDMYVRRGEGQEGEAGTGENNRGVGVRRVDKTYIERVSK